MDMSHHYSNTVLPQHEESHAKWLDRARAWAVARAKEKGTVTADDIWFNCSPPVDVNKKVIGAVFYPRDAWEKVGYKASIRRACHGRPIAIWKLRSKPETSA